MKKEELLLLDGHFFWSFGHEFFIETTCGNFIWSDPDYPNGDNTIRAYSGSYNDWLDTVGIDYARDKGHHSILYYVGETFEIKDA
jgi:hypothetical protein